jgi:hypothetical protein
MTDQQQNQERAWTRLVYCTASERVHPPGKPDEFVAKACPTVGELFALAPELAEAVLAYHELAQAGDSVTDCSRQMYGLADKLRQIGGAS